MTDNQKDGATATAKERSSATRPIIFSGPMVRAILDGRTAQARRVIIPQPIITERGCPSWGTPGGKRIRNGPRSAFGGSMVTMTELIGEYSPYGVPGDRLWVKERHYISNVDRGNPKVCVEYEDGTYRITDKHPLPTLNDYGEYDDGVRAPGFLCRWRNASAMPRWASRTDVEVMAASVENTNDIWDWVGEFRRIES